MTLIDYSLTKFVEAEIWPRPAGARRLRIGHDFSLRDIDYFHEQYPISQRMALVEFFDSNDFLKSLYYPSALEVWVPLLTAVLADTAGTEIDDRVFERHFRRYLKELLSPTITWRQVDTFTGLKCDFKFILDSKSHVKPIPGWHFRPTLAGQWLDFAYCWLTKDDAVAIVTQETVPRQPSPTDWYAGRRSQALERVLRFLKPGTPRLHAHAVAQVSTFPLWSPMAICFDRGRSQSYEPEVAVRRRDTPRIRQLWHEAFTPTRPARRTDPRLELAEGRFLSTYGEGGWIGQIVDLTVATEALLGPTDERELSYRLATRAAHLLGSRGEPDQRSYTIVKTMYDARSATVHGTPGDEKVRGRWLSRISGTPYRWEEGTYKLMVPAMEEARSVVRSLIVGCQRIMETQGPGASITWPLPDDFEYQMMDIRRRKGWQAHFPPRVAATSNDQ